MLCVNRERGSAGHTTGFMLMGIMSMSSQGNGRSAKSSGTTIGGTSLVKTMTRRIRREPPPDFDNLEPNYSPGYLEHRRREAEAYDQLPAWARKVLRRAKHEWQATQVLARIKSGDKPIDILTDIEHCEASLSRDYLKQFTLK